LSYFGGAVVAVARGGIAVDITGLNFAPLPMSRLLLVALLLFTALKTCAQEMPSMWSSAIGADSKAGQPDTRWFQEAKFGLFIHWGLYSGLGNTWREKNYYGSGEWIMNRAKIPAAEYEKLAASFNPVNFDADAWARFARDAGARYVVITAKHHEGFAMYRSKVSPFNIVDATPYQKDPMAALAEATRREGVKFGFYYSQFLDWHEPNGGGNTWDFGKGDKDHKKYYAEKSIPQIKELLSNYGPLGLVWFDMPGGLTREETVGFIGEVRRLQPQTLISSRVGQGLGDFRDFGDSELPPSVIEGPWEALFTHNDSWGFVQSDQNFKTPREILRLLAATAARGGNLLLNVGPDGTGRIPEKSLAYLREVGSWLTQNGESIYATTASPIPDQPWGVATLKPGKLYLHVFERPADGTLLVPGFNATATRARFLGEKKNLKINHRGSDLTVALPAALPDARDSVIVVEFSGELANSWSTAPVVISRQFPSIAIDAANARLTGKAKAKSITHSRYFGNWKHDTCTVGQLAPTDRAEFSLRFTEPGDYRLILEYACPVAMKNREGVVQVGDQRLPFETLFTGPYDTHQALMLVRHTLGVVAIDKAGELPLAVQPLNNGPELFWLRRVILEPVR
jgi:alpha-L-fucosidase